MIPCMTVVVVVDGCPAVCSGLKAVRNAGIATPRHLNIRTLVIVRIRIVCCCHCLAAALEESSHEVHIAMDCKGV